MPSKFPPKRPDNSHLVKARVKLDWSPFQKAIFKDVALGNGHTVVQAYAGSSKTTSIVESFRYLPKGKKTLCLAFNKIIQEELKSRAPSYIDVLTFHSLGLRAIKQRFGNIELDDNKVFDLVKGQLSDPEYDLITNICDTVAFCKYGLQDTPAQIDKIIDLFGIDVCGMDRKVFISLVVKTLGLDKAQTSKIDFNDMCWFPFVHNLFLGTYDFVYVDEYQDLNKSQLVMAKKACNANGGRIIACGDTFQDLYSWRGSDSSIVEELKTQAGAKTLPLPISYRCPKNVIELAKHWVPDITCPDTAPDGEVEDISLNQLYTIAKPGCFILSRTNAPLIKICMAFIRLGVKANIRGRDIGKQLAYLIKKSKKKQIASFLTWLKTWRDDETAKLQEKNINPENVWDRYECLVNLCEECKTLEEATKKVNELFNDTDEKNIIMLSSVHRAKGLEADDVFLLKWTFRLWLNEELALIDKPNEEANIAYVGATRTKKRLFLVSKL
jgi:superfamily I DNA/RNA helicase